MLLDGEDNDKATQRLSYWRLSKGDMPKSASASLAGAAFAPALVSAWRRRSY